MFPPRAFCGLRHFFVPPKFLWHPFSYLSCSDCYEYVIVNFVFSLSLSSVAGTRRFSFAKVVTLQDNGSLTGQFRQEVTAHKEMK
jgi:hypothetical protein